MDKVKLRQMMKEKRLKNFETFSSFHDVIFTKLKSHQKYIDANIIGCYVSLPQEIETLSFVEETLQTKRVCVPRVEGNIMHFYEIHSLKDLKEGHFHVLEPITNERINPSDIELMIVPLLAYDQLNYRVGYGKGYYDKYFHSGCIAYKIGLAYSYQYVDHIDVDCHDYPLDEILTEIPL